MLLRNCSLDRDRYTRWWVNLASVKPDWLVSLLRAHESAGPGLRGGAVRRLRCRPTGLGSKSSVNFRSSRTTLSRWRLLKSVTDSKTAITHNSSVSSYLIGAR